MSPMSDHGPSNTQMAHWSWLLTVVMLGVPLVILPTTTTRTLATTIVCQFVLCSYLVYVPTAEGARMSFSFWGHLLPGMILARFGCFLRNGDGGPPLVPGPTALAVSAALFCLTIGEPLTAGLQHFYNWVHVVIHAQSWILGMSGGLDPLAAKFRAHGAPWAPSPAEVRAFRKLLDPGCFLVIGLLFLGHVHELTPASIFFHRTLGAMLCMVGLAMLASTMVHDSLPHDCMACLSLRLVHAFAWLLSGLWMITMSILFYSCQDNSFAMHAQWCARP